jgi:hypothetical protein
MATEALKSTPITNRDAVPSVFNDAGVDGGLLRQAVATLEHTAKDLGSTFRMVRIPSNATGIAVVLSSDDQGTTGDIDIGIYQTTANGGAVVDADFFASAYDVNAAAIAQVEVQHESAVYGLEDIEKPLWEALGLSADTNRDYDIVITSTEALQAAGTLSLRVTYTL